MQLTLNYCWLKSLNSVCNVFSSGLIPIISKVPLNYPNLLSANKPCILSRPILRQFNVSINNNSAKNKRYLDNVQSLFDIEEDESRPPKHETNYSFESSHKKPNYIRQEELLQNELKMKAVKVNKITNEDWEAIKRSILEMQGSINEENIDAIIMNNSSEFGLSLCKSYFKYLKSTEKRINRATYGSYLRAFYFCSSSCSEDDLKEILQIYKELITVYPILDSYTAEKAILALCLTENWKEYDKLFKEIKKSYHPTGLVYGAIIKTSFKNAEVELGWQLMEEMMLNCGRVSNDIYMCWLERNKENNGLIRVLNFLNKFNSMPSYELSGEIIKCFNQINTQGKGVFTTIVKSGLCKHCNSKLERAWVSKDDYNNLKLAFLDPVLIGKDIFLKTRPEEFNEFLQFLERTAPYDVVLDGLNIALKIHRSKRTPKSLATQLKTVVKHFVDQKKKVLVFGRKHMTKWPKEELKFIEENAHVFLADDMSQDDPFLLYATLYSGIGTCFVSQDMMRGHKFLLRDPKLQATFHKWQAQHQCFITYIEKNVVHMRDPVPFMQTIQQNSLGDWHIPYEVKEDLTTYSRIDNFHKHWLCLTNCTVPHQKGKRFLNERTTRR